MTTNVVMLNGMGQAALRVLLLTEIVHGVLKYNTT